MGKNWFEEQYDKAKDAVAPVAKIVPKITISKADQSLKGIGKLAGNYVTVVAETMIAGPVLVDKYLLNNNLDIYTGGLIGDAKNAAATTRELAGGKGVTDNIKSGIRVGAVVGAGVATAGIGTGTAAGGVGISTALAGKSIIAAYSVSAYTAGLSQKSWNEVASVLGNTFLPPVAAKIIDTVLKVIGPGTTGVTNNTTYTPSDAGNPLVLQDVVEVKYIILGVVGIGVLLLLLKKKKRK